MQLTDTLSLDDFGEGDFFDRGEYTQLYHRVDMRNNSVYSPKDDDTQKSSLYPFQVGYLSGNSLYNRWILTISGKVLDIMTKLCVMHYLTRLFGVIDGKFPSNK